MMVVDEHFHGFHIIFNLPVALTKFGLGPIKKISDTSMFRAQTRLSSLKIVHATIVFLFSLTVEALDKKQIRDCGNFLSLRNAYPERC